MRHIWEIFLDKLGPVHKWEILNAVINYPALLSSVYEDSEGCKYYSGNKDKHCYDMASSRLLFT